MTMTPERLKFHIDALALEIIREIAYATHSAEAAIEFSGLQVAAIAETTELLHALDNAANKIGLMHEFGRHLQSSLRNNPNNETPFPS